MFFDSLEKYGGNTAVIDKYGRQYSYLDLASICSIFADQTESNNKIINFILCDNTIESLAAYLSTLQINGTALLLDKDIDKSLFNELISAYDPDYIWEPVKPNIEYSFIYNKFGLIKKKSIKQKNIHPDLSLLLSTSGSTGSSKLVRLTKKNIQANAVSIAEYLKLSNKEKPITTLPMNYSYGLSIINSHLLAGAAILLTNDSIITKSFWEFFKKYEATSFAGVPYMYEVLKKIRIMDMNLPSLKYMTQAGGKLNPILVKEYAEYSRSRGIKFYVMYGQTEATARISYLPHKRNMEKYKSIGIPVPGGKLEVHDDNRNKITEPYTEGELVYSGENVMMGYATCLDDLSKGDMLNGLLRTGDIGYFDEDGFFYITGRIKRFLKIFGNRVNLDEIEQYLKEKNHQCVCGGTDDYLCIATVDENKLSIIKSLVLNKYHFHHSVVNVVKIDEIIKNSSGKIQYQEIYSMISTCNS